MSSWFRPKPTAPTFTPVNLPPLKGLTIGYHDGPPPAAQLAALDALGPPLLCRMPVRNEREARIQLDALRPYPRLFALLLIEDITDVPSFVLDDAKLWGVQFGNETDLPPYNWPPERFADRTLLYYTAWRDAGYRKPCVSGGIFSVEAKESNGDWHAHAYLSPLLTLARTRMPDLIIAVHWYGDSSDTWKAKLTELCKGFRVSVSEYGKPSRTPAEDHAQTLYLASKDRDFYAFGATFTCIYEAASAADASDLSNYGLFRADGTVKPGFECLGQRP